MGILGYFGHMPTAWAFAGHFGHPNAQMAKGRWITKKLNSERYSNILKPFFIVEPLNFPYYCHYLIEILIICIFKIKLMSNLFFSILMSRKKEFLK